MVKPFKLTFLKWRVILLLDACYEKEVFCEQHDGRKPLSNPGGLA